MSKGLEALEKGFWKLTHKGNIDYYNIVEKELKAIDVIKDICNLKVYKNKLGQCFLEGTNILFPISQETYDLLKEVLL